MHDLPQIHDLWTERFVAPLFAEVGFANIDELWERQIANQCRLRAPEPVRLVSLGAGNGEAEVQLAARLAEQGVSNLDVVLVELNPAMLERALASAERVGLGGRVRAQQADLNTWVAGETAHVYLAIHSLHHVVALESLFDQVAQSIDERGVLLVNDMVGRNGHVRWPEAGEIVRMIWRLAPERYRYNHSLKRVDDEYPDLDCSVEGFEGIRSQDVLPMLLERFHPEVYVTFANIIDPFVDRVYGPNFDLDQTEDVSFIESVARLDEAAIELGIVTPTHLVASFRRRPVDCRYPGHRSPERTVRDPLIGPGRSGDLASDEADAQLRAAKLEAELRTARYRYRCLRSRRAVRMALALADARHRARRFVQR